MPETHSCDTAFDCQIDRAARMLADSIVCRLGEPTLATMACEVLVALLVSVPAVLASCFV
jgi:hypothetical protein